jgi:hypothetical protein
MHIFSVLTSLEGMQQYIMACIDNWVGSYCKGNNCRLKFKEN